MNAFTIKDLENLSGIKAHTIRIWEQRYAFLKPQRTETNIRVYTNEELKRLLNVALLNKYGFKISHIDRMSEADILDKLLGLNAPQAMHERIVNDMVNCISDLDIDTLELILDEYIHTRGIEKAINNIIFPFLEKIGILWITNHINPAQEHVVTNIIRQKLIMGIETVRPSHKVEKTFLLFLPESEYHELGLLYVHYLLKARGLKVWYLGANVPIKDLQTLLEAKKPDVVYTHLTSVLQSFNFEKFLSKLGNASSTVPFVVSGHMTAAYQKPLPSNITFKKSLQEVMEYVNSF